MEPIVTPDGMYNTKSHELSDREFKTVLPLVIRELRHAEKMVEHYHDLTCDGFGTERQLTAKMTWDEKVEILSGIVDYAKKTIGYRADN